MKLKNSSKHFWAEKRAEVWNRLTPQEQLTSLESRFSDGATKQKEKIRQVLEATS